MKIMAENINKLKS